MKTKLSLLAVSLLQLYVTSAMAQEQTTSPLFTLGQISVQTQQDSTTSADESVITLKDIDRFRATDLAKAVNTQAGVSLDMIGARNEMGIYMRGYDSRQVPIFIDGIPQYVPYDGYVDFNRFLTSDLSEIRVAKGGASLLYGPNTLGGAINLVTRKPTKAFEGDITLGVDSAGSKNAVVNLGTKQDLFYIQGGFAYLGSDKYRLPHSFNDPKKNPTDTGRYRQNAETKDVKYSIKLGITPNATDEYAIGYSGIRGEKEQPVYVGEDSTVKSRYWRWPQWDKDSFYFISNTRLSEGNEIRTRLYYDTYTNGLQSYTDDSYSVHDDNLSVYKDKTYGGSLTWVNTSLDNNQLEVSYQYKRDRHYDEDSSNLFVDQIHVIAAEDKVRFNDQWALRVGVGYESLRTTHLPSEFDKKTSTHSTNALAELDYQVTPDHLFYGLISTKSRFPTLKDRYSYRFKRALPNPDLESERSTNLELGWKGQLFEGNNVHLALFYSRLHNEIQTARISDPDNLCPSNNGFCNQSQNVGRSQNAGVELTISQRFGDRFEAGLNYTYLNRKNKEDSSLPMLGTPRHKGFVYLQYSPVESLDLLATLNAESGRVVSYEDDYKTLSGFTTVDLSANWRVYKGFELEAGITNLTDQYYEYSDGYPMPGRTVYGKLRYRF